MEINSAKIFRANVSIDQIAQNAMAASRQQTLKFSLLGSYFMLNAYYCNSVDWMELFADIWNGLQLFRMFAFFIDAATARINSFKRIENSRADELTRSEFKWHQQATNDISSLKFASTADAIIYIYAIVRYVSILKYRQWQFSEEDLLLCW